MCETRTFLTDEALDFVATLAGRFTPELVELLAEAARNGKEVAVKVQVRCF